MIAYDLCCGLGGWTEGFQSEGYRVIGYDIEAHEYGNHRYPGELRIKSILELNGAELADADAIVASPPCQRYSYMAMPWSRAKEMTVQYRKDIGDLNDLFNACFQIQQEASLAARRYIPLVVENVKGAQPWVGSAAWHYGSFYLWGDVPALMPFPRGMKNNGGSWFGERDGKPLDRNDPRDLRRNENGDWENAADRGGWNHPGKALDGLRCATKNDGGSWFNIAHNTVSGKANNQGLSGPAWFDEGISKSSSRSDSRKAASALIAKIPFELSSHIARCFKPRT